MSAALIREALSLTAKNIFNSHKELFSEKLAGTKGTIEDIIKKPTLESAFKSLMMSPLGDRLVNSIADRSPVLGDLAAQILENYRALAKESRFADTETKSSTPEKANERKSEIVKILSSGRKMNAKDFAAHREQHKEVYEKYDAFLKRDGLSVKQIQQTQSATGQAELKQLTSIATNTKEASLTLKTMSGQLQQLDQLMIEMDDTIEERNPELRYEHQREKIESGLFGKQDEVLKTLASRTNKNDVTDVVEKQPKKDDKPTFVDKIVSLIKTKAKGTKTYSAGKAIVDRSIDMVNDSMIKPARTFGSDVVDSTVAKTLEKLLPKGTAETGIAAAEGSTMVGGIMSTLSSIAQIPAIGLGAAGMAGFGLGSSVVAPGLDALSSVVSGRQNTFGGAIYDLLNEDAGQKAITPSKGNFVQSIDNLNQQRDSVVMRPATQNQQPIIVSSPPTIVGSNGSSSQPDGILMVRNNESSFSKVQMQDYWSKTA